MSPAGGCTATTERMGAGYVTGTEQEVDTLLSDCVGGPLSTVRAEAASLLQLLRDLSGGSPTPMLVFIDCLVLLDILHWQDLQRWGQASFHSQPTDIVHFDIIFPLLDELLRWLGPLQLVKVKSHSGCLLKERADEYAECGCREETPEICPAPRKLGSV